MTATPNASTRAKSAGTRPSSGSSARSRASAKIASPRTTTSATTKASAGGRAGAKPTTKTSTAKRTTKSKTAAKTASKTAAKTASKTASKTTAKRAAAKAPTKAKKATATTKAQRAARAPVSKRQAAVRISTATAPKARQLPVRELPKSQPERRAPARLAIPSERPRMGAVVRDLITHHADALLANHDGALSGENPDAVHDMRVASRRLRTAIDLFKDHLPHKRTRQAKKQLRAVTRALGGPRELDVKLAMLKGVHKRAGDDAERAAIESAMEVLHERRLSQGQAMTRALGAIDFGALRKTLGSIAKAVHGWKGDDLGAEAWAKIEPLIPPALGDMAKLRKREDADEMHAARIAVKRMRYAIELLEAAFLTDHKALRDRARDLQELLGDHHDLHVLEQWLADRIAQLRETKRATLIAGTTSAMAHVRRQLSDQYTAFVSGSVDLNADAFAKRVRAAIGLNAPNT